MSTKVPNGELLAMAGTVMPPSEWVVVDQERIDLFAEATGDHQFIHVDPVRAAETPFGGTIAHGYLTLSLLPCLLSEVTVVPEGTVMGINYGLNKVRFLQPLRAGSKVRALAKILRVEEKGSERILITTEVAIEIQGQSKPALVAETLSMFVTG